MMPTWFRNPLREVQEILDRSTGLRHLSDRQLREASEALRYRARGGMAIDQRVLQGFPLVREAARRTLGMEHHPVQILAGWHLVHGSFIEMETGQGKTLTATLPLYLRALEGRGVHLATSNDYLAVRDADRMRPLFDLLGLTCGSIVESMPDEERALQYRKDITYGTGNEFGFDFLRDRLRRGRLNAARRDERKVQRELYFMLVDEADSLLIDDANTPLVLGSKGASRNHLEPLIRWSTHLAPQTQEGEHYQYHAGTREISLTERGRMWARQQIDSGSLRDQCSMFELFEWIERGIHAYRNFHRDQQYIIRDEEIVLVNEGTGRLGEGRQLQNGLHQILQAREGLPVTPENTHAARITVQGFFLGYRHLVGMSGTLWSGRNEIRSVYRRKVVRIPTAQPSLRHYQPCRWFLTSGERWLAICDEVDQTRKNGRPVLIGTRTVEKSETLSALLTERGIPHHTLHAKHHAQEAAIIARAGSEGAVTVATGMAGRGTDIPLTEGARHSGGLHVIVSELHDSERSDQQLFGRCARQGDPGTCRQFLSLDDAILDRTYGFERASRIRRRTSLNAVPNVLRTAQRSLERSQRNARIETWEKERQRLKSWNAMGMDPVLEALT